MRVLLYQLDGALPNIALMRLAAHHSATGDSVELRRTGKPDRTIFDDLNPPDIVYASAIFKKSRPTVERLLQSWPNAIVGGTGWNLATRLEDYGITTNRQDYGIYPGYRDSIGFTQRGCRLQCKFCVVPEKEGRIAEVNTIAEIWRGDPYPRNLVLLDNDFFGQKHWRERIAEIREGNFKVSFNQGINARFLTDEAAEAIASVNYYSGDFSRRCIYTAWDSRKDEDRLFAGLNRLVKYGVKPDHIMVYMLVGFEHDRLTDDDFHRHRALRAFGARPYPMPFVRTKELVGFQRWIVGAYDKRIAWADWERAGYEPRNLGHPISPATSSALAACTSA